MHKKHVVLAIIACATLASCSGDSLLNRKHPAESKVKDWELRYSQINTLFDKIEKATQIADYEAATALYQQVLEIDAKNLVAQTGLRMMAQLQRHAQLVEEANAFFQAGELEQAKLKLRPVLIENPNQVTALTLLKNIEASVSEKNQIIPKKLKPTLSKNVTLEFKDAGLRNVFQMISRTTGINFVFDPAVREDLKASIFVKDTSVDEAIDFLLMMHQLHKKVLTDTSLLIYPASRAAQYEDLILRSFYLNHADAKQTTNLIKQMLPIKDVFVDDKLNMITVKATHDQLKDVSKLIVDEDQAEPEVILDVEILEVKRSRLTDLGANFPDSISLAGAGTGVITWKEMTKANSSNIKLSPLPTINLLRQDGDTNLLANPRIRVKNREKAKIHIGDKIPIETTTASATGYAVGKSANYLDVGLKLEVEPRVMLNNEVSIKLSLDVSNATLPTGATYPTVNTRNTATVMMTGDGETQILAGLINDEDRKSTRRVPGIGSLPLLGRLFTDVNDSKSKTEVVLLITPHVVRNISTPGAENQEFYAGMGARSGPINFNPAAVLQQVPGQVTPNVLVPSANPAVALPGQPATIVSEPAAVKPNNP